MTANIESPRGGPLESGPLESGSGRSTVDLALQVANIAALVSAARRSADEGKCSELAARLAQAQVRLLEQEIMPEGLILFLDVMQGLLSGDDVSALADDLPVAYRAVYEQLVGEVAAGASASGVPGPGTREGTLTVREVMDEVARNVILAMVRGTFEQRRQMSDTLLVMEQELLERPDLEELRYLLQAARLLLQGVDPTPIVEQLLGPFKACWEQIVEAIRE